MTGVKLTLMLTVLFYLFVRDGNSNAGKDPTKSSEGVVESWVEESKLRMSMSESQVLCTVPDEPWPEKA